MITFEEMTGTKEKKRICIIGAGASGITAAKACQEEDLDYVIYEMYHTFGGLWRYKDKGMIDMASVANSTIINSSKEMSAFSDFPPDPSYPNYMHHTKMIKFIEDYAKHVGCLNRIKFSHKVLNVVRGSNFEDDGRWMVEVQDEATGALSTETFDGVMICTGHHTKPSEPRFPGQELFKGKIIHTHSYKKPGEFEGKKVVVVGIGNSGVDVAVDLSMVNDKVYLSTKRGAWILNRIGPNGMPSDVLAVTRWKNWLIKRLPRSLVNSLTEKSINERFDHSLYKIKPNHGVFQQNYTINDTLPHRILSGTIVLKNNIDRLTETGVIFEGNTEEVACDVIILATGYKISFPFISRSLVPINDNKLDLYKNVFSSSLGHTLAFIGLVQADGPLLPVSEMQSRWFASCIVGNTQLPPVEKMNKHMEKKRKLLEAQFYPSPRHTLQVNWMSYMDELAELVGCKPNLHKLLFTDFKLWKKLLFGPCLPYQYRLQGPHKWSGAREAIFSAKHRVKAPFKSRKLTDENGKIIEEQTKVKKKVKEDDLKKKVKSFD